MYRDRKIIIVVPAYNASETLLNTYEEILAQDYVDEIIVVDDASSDDSEAVLSQLDQARVLRHSKNLGYGANQKTCYRSALEMGADIVIMVHGDYQYTPRLIPAMVTLIGGGVYDCVIGSRILGGQALSGGMPWWRYAGNRMLTAVLNLVTGAQLSEYHTGYRAYSRQLLEKLPLEANSNDFLFDNQVLLETIWLGSVIAEVSCPTRYRPESSSIGFWRSIVYGFGCLVMASEFVLARLGVVKSRRFAEKPPDLELRKAK